MKPTVEADSAIGLDISLTHCKIADVTPRGRIPTLSQKEALILDLLVVHDELYGLQLVAASRRRLKRGTVYVTLGRMEEKGYIQSHLEDGPPKAGGLPRRVYEPTAFGRRLLSVWTYAVEQLRPEFAR
jgi:PadR family transcriptional regulator